MKSNSQGPTSAHSTLETVLAEIRALRADLQASCSLTLTVEETAELLRISPKTIRNGLGARAVKPFPIRSIKVGGRVLFRRSDVETYIAGLLA